MKITPFIFILFLSVVACNNHKPSSEATAIPTPTSTSTSSSTPPYSVTVVNDVPTLTQNGLKFRVVYSSKEDSELYLEKLEGDKWSRILSTDQPRYGDTLADWNKDGYLDLVVHRKWQDEVFIFNPKTNIFESIGEFGDELMPLASVKDVYYDKTSWKDGSKSSNLIKIVGGNVKILANLQSRYGDEKKEINITVKKDEQTVDSLNLPEATDEEDDMINTYWANNIGKYSN